MDKSIKIKVLFYIPNLTQKEGGLRQYAACLLNLFINFPESYSFFILHENNDPVIIDIISKHAAFKIISRQAYKISFFKRSCYKITYAFQKAINFFLKLNLHFTTPPDSLTKLVKKNHIDIFHSPFQHIPDVKHVKLISTMHDVQELHFPEFFTAKQRAYRAVHYNDYISRAHAIVVSYDHIKKDIIKYFDKKPDDVHVALMKMDNLWFSKFKSSDIKSCDVTGTPNKYLFYPANAWYHKNHESLIKAVYYLKTEKLININIVFSGDNETECGKSLLMLIASYNLESQIKFLGIVDELRLYSLYQNAWGIVVPTLYEAGSFPLIESILMHLPVICSNVTSLPETMGDNNFIFEPSNIKNIAEKVEKLWNDDNFRLAARDNTLLREDKLINTSAAFTIENLYKRLLD